MRPFLCLLLALSPAFAQEKPDEPKKRMVFSLGGGENTPAPSPSPASPVPASRVATGVAEPTDAISTFFLALKAKQVDAAYDELVKNTIVVEKKEDLAGLKSSTKLALDNYGTITGFETLNLHEAGTTLRRYTCISLNEDLPLRWRFYFYRSPGGWKLVDLRVDDALAELFDESPRKKKP